MKKSSAKFPIIIPAKQEHYHMLWFPTEFTRRSIIPCVSVQNLRRGIAPREGREFWPRGVDRRNVAMKSPQKGHEKTLK